MTEPTKRRRSRKADGGFNGNTSSSVNDAWEATDMTEALPKEHTYSVQQMVTGTSEPTAGKYSKKAKIRPQGTFGDVHTTYN